MQNVFEKATLYGEKLQESIFLSPYYIQQRDKNSEYSNSLRRL